VFFFVSRLVCLCVGDSSNKYYVMVYGSILMWFSALFHNRLLFQMHYIFLIFVARWRHNFREIAVKIAKSPKIGGKVCAHNFVEIAEGFEENSNAVV